MQRMHVARRGAISGMVLAEQPAFDEPLAPYEVEVQMQAVGLNFRDVLLVLGEYPGPPEPTGSDCAGIVTAAGELAAHARDDELFGIAAGCLEHFVRARTHMQLMARRPASITAAEACTLAHDMEHGARGAAPIGAPWPADVPAACGGGWYRPRVH